MSTISIVAKRGLMKYAREQDLLLQTLGAVVVDEGLGFWNMSCPSTASPAISPLASAQPSRVVTTPTLLSGMSIAFASSTRTGAD